MHTPEPFDIYIKEHLSAESLWFEDLALREAPEGGTILSGSLDQAALHGVLMRIRDLGLTIISVNARKSNDEKENEQ